MLLFIFGLRLGQAPSLVIKNVVEPLNAPRPRTSQATKSKTPFNNHTPVQAYPTDKEGSPHKY